MYDYEDSYEETGIDENVGAGRLRDALRTGSIEDTALESCRVSTFGDAGVMSNDATWCSACPTAPSFRSPSCRAGDTACLTMALAQAETLSNRSVAEAAPASKYTRAYSKEAISCASSAFPDPASASPARPPSAPCSEQPHGAWVHVCARRLGHDPQGLHDLDDYLRAIREEHFTVSDNVVYHFRISTQAGVSPEMTHPFPLSNRPACRKLTCAAARAGVAHNGVIPDQRPSNERYTTASPQTTTVIAFITDCLSHIIRRRLTCATCACWDSISQIAQSRFAIMDGGGYIATVQFIDERGLLFSNASYPSRRMR